MPRLTSTPTSTSTALGLAIALTPLACTPAGSDDGTTFATFGDDGDDTSGDGDPTGDGDTNCGDGVVDPGEQCDLGPQNSDAGVCTTGCTLAECGDGFVYTGFEECDDGNSSNTDDCVHGCKLATCGDGFVHAGVEECDDGNDVETDACLPVYCKNAQCGDGIVWAGMEQCDDGNNQSGDGCDATCNSECNGTILVQGWNGWTYYKVPVEGTLSDANVAAACSECGLQIPCTGPVGCSYNANNCAQTNNENSCSNPMQGLALHLCGTSPSQCAQLWGVYQHMGNNWVSGAACGAEQNSWCSIGTNTSNKFALCVSQ